MPRAGLSIVHQVTIVEQSRPTATVYYGLRRVHVDPEGPYRLGFGSRRDEGVSRLMLTIGSILHGAYGDIYEQLVCLKSYKKRHPEIRLILFFSSEHRHKEFLVFDLSFADEVH